MLKEGEVYWPRPTFHTGLDTVQQTFCFDQQKWNLFWLAEPRVDTEHISAAHQNPIARSIHEHMTQDLLGYLTLLPAQFLNWWLSLKNFDDLQITKDWPPNHRTVVSVRAKAAQDRLLGKVVEGNVVRVNFKRRSA